MDKATSDLLKRLRGCLAALDGELTKAAAADAAAAVAAAEAPPPAPPPPSVEDMKRVKQMVDEAEGLAKTINDHIEASKPKPAAGDAAPTTGTAPAGGAHSSAQHETSHQSSSRK